MAPAILVISFYVFATASSVGIPAPAEKDCRFSCLLHHAVGFAVVRLPGRVGEVVRPLYLARKGSAQCAIGTIVVERVFDMLTMRPLAFPSRPAALRRPPRREPGSVRPAALLGRSGRA
jgi:hypothetical protein